MLTIHSMDMGKTPRWLLWLWVVADRLFPNTLKSIMLLATIGQLFEDRYKYDSKNLLPLGVPHVGVRVSE